MIPPEGGHRFELESDRWHRVNEIFQDAMARAADERDAFVAGVCSGDEPLRKYLERLLRADGGGRGFLDAPAFANAQRVLALGSARLSSAARQIETTDLQDDFPGTPRFEVLGRIGAGGMGVVYAVHDRERNEVVALKTLRRASAADLYRLKREFRSLADIAHRNVVSLYELTVETGRCFFTMELVDGVSIPEYVRIPGTAMRADGPLDTRADPDRVRDVLRQLIAGISELHRHGKIHRDIKPSNILVTPQGRVVILDFGLISHVLPDTGDTIDRMAGTPAYLAPEQHFGAAASAASDWYAVGVTLYEALTGRLPFTGSYRELRMRTSNSDPPPPALVDPDVPDDLNEICMGLLCREPAERLSGPDALAKAATHATVKQEGFRGEPFRRNPMFVGRTRELDALGHAFAAARAGHAAAVCIHGPSGIGKTALVQQFIEQVTGDAVVVLRGRCYEHESVPYKALDGIIDSLSAYLASLPSSDAAALIPFEVASLARAFPVMLQVDAVAHAARRDAGTLDPSAQRRLAVSVLRDLLARIAERHALVLHIDDLHWADADSTLLLDAVLGGSDAPPLLMLACVRAEEIASKPFLQRIVNGGGSSCWTAVALEAMTEEDTRQLIAALVPADARMSASHRRALALEAGGNPFLLEQLACYAAAHAAANADATFADFLTRRLHELPGGARRFLEVLAVCGRPMTPQIVHAAAGLTGDERPLVALLRSDRLLRNSGSASRIETYHDRIRETLATQLSPDATRRIHALLVRTLTASGADDPEALFEHCRGAGDRVGASHQAALAAAKARAALAFDTAAFFYRSAFELAPDAAAAAEWRERLAESLTNAGRPYEAAQVYLEASRSADRTRQMDLQRRAAEQFLVGGHIDEGMAVIRTVLDALGMRLARSPLGALASLAWHRTRLRRRGLGFVERDAAHIAADTLLRIDTCWSVATGLAMVDSIRGAEFNTRHLLLALEAGEPYRIARALAVELGSLVSSAPRHPMVAEYAEHTARVASRSGHAHADALCAAIAGVRAVFVGEWKTAALLCERALDVLREQCAGATWELNCAECFFLGSLLFQGEIREVSRRLPSLLTAARDRGNLYFETELRTRMNLVWLAADKPDEGERQADEAMERWSHQGFYRQHYNHVLARIQTELYRGRAERAWDVVRTNWRSFQRTQLLRIQFLRIETSFLRARCALLMAAGQRDRRRFLSIARKDARRIGSCGTRWSDSLVMLLTATILYLENRPREAGDRLAAAVDAFEDADMKLYAAVARRRLGLLQGGDSGRDLVDAANDWMAGQGIVNADAITRLIAPGFPDRRAD